MPPVAQYYVLTDCGWLEKAWGAYLRNAQRVGDLTFVLKKIIQ